MIQYIKQVLIISLLFFISCSQSIKKETAPNTFSQLNQQQDLYFERDVNSSVDSMYIYYQHALKALEFGDSIGARIYYDKIFSEISDFDEETKSILLEWKAYNKLIKKINSDYETIFAQDIFDQEAEEIREEITAYE